MSVSPSSSSGQTLGQVLIDRAFAKPPRQMVDGELMHALEEARAADKAKTAPADEPPRPQVDVRA